MGQFMGVWPSPPPMVGVEEEKKRTKMPLSGKDIN